MKLYRIPELKEIQKVAKILYERGWAEANAGNISVRIEEKDLPGGFFKGRKLFLKHLTETFGALENKVFIITKAGARMRDMVDDPLGNLAIIKIGEKGKSYFSTNELPITSEYMTHFILHSYFVQEKPSYRVILHTHPTRLVACSHIKKFKDVLLSIHPEIKVKIPEGIEVVKATPGSKILAEKTLKAFKKHRVIVWEKHGVITAEENLEKALDLIEILEKAAEIFFLIKKI